MTRVSRDLAPLGLRMPPEIKERIEAAAKENGRSMNAEILDRLQKSFESNAFEEKAGYLMRDFTELQLEAALLGLWLIGFIPNLQRTFAAEHAEDVAAAMKAARKAANRADEAMERVQRIAGSVQRLKAENGEAPAESVEEAAGIKTKLPRRSKNGPAAKEDT